VLSHAIERTVERRSTAVPCEPPIAMTLAFMRGEVIAESCPGRLPSLDEPNFALKVLQARFKVRAAASHHPCACRESRSQAKASRTEPFAT
jgi:hypothetical protein